MSTGAVSNLKSYANIAHDIEGLFISSCSSLNTCNINENLPIDALSLTLLNLPDELKLLLLFLETCTNNNPFLW